VSYGAQNLISSAHTHTHTHSHTYGSTKEKLKKNEEEQRDEGQKSLVMKFFAQSTLMRIMPAAGQGQLSKSMLTRCQEMLVVAWAKPNHNPDSLPHKGRCAHRCNQYPPATWWMAFGNPNQANLTGWILL